MEHYTYLVAEARQWGKQKHPEAIEYFHKGFANSVGFLVEGVVPSTGHTSVRENIVAKRAAQIDLPPPGTWGFEDACTFAELICYPRETPDLPHITKDPIELEGYLKLVVQKGQSVFCIWNPSTDENVTCYLSPEADARLLERAINNKVVVRGTIFSTPGVKQFCLMVEQLELLPS